jgi:hypothetical protein
VGRVWIPGNARAPVRRLSENREVVTGSGLGVVAEVFVGTEGVAFQEVSESGAPHGVLAADGKRRFQSNTDFTTGWSRNWLGARRCASSGDDKMCDELCVREGA